MNAVIDKPASSVRKLASAPIENKISAPVAADSMASLLEAERKWCSAKHLLSACLDTYTENINYAADSLIEVAYQLLQSATENGDYQKADEAHSEMWRAAAVIQYRMCDNECGAEEMFALEGIHHLMTEAMDLVTKALSQAAEGGDA
ncbi:hypothetical protein ABIC94_002109 [Variovorax paradoxus]|uniref:hypothetical protein n=1 Tax=Variovorax paradoxus TaxID=34073 RepID=UPI00339819F8